MAEEEIGKPGEPSWPRVAALGAWTGTVVWFAECVAAAGVNASIGGFSVLLALRTPLARWGLAYLFVGALIGLTRLTPARMGGPLLGWIALVVLADAGVAPRWVSAILVLLAVLAIEGASRIWVIAGAHHGVGLTGLTVALALGSIGVPGESPRGEADAGPDVVLLVVDTLRADHVGSAGYGRDTTPNIDALAAEGLCFTAARSTSSWTLPSHASLFTGEPPSAHGAHASSPVLDGERETLAEAFDRRGYRTVGLSANAWVSGGTGLDRGFEQFEFLGADGITSQLLLPLVFSTPEDFGGRAITDAAIAAISDAADADERLFLFANYLEAHEPLGTLPEPELSRFSKAPLDPNLGRAWVRDMPLFWCLCSGDSGDLTCEDGRYRADSERIRGVVDRYDAGVAYVDARIGEIRRALVDAGRDRDTVFVVTSDHGEHLGEEGRLGHMVWLTDELVEIPLVVRYPAGIDAGTVDSKPIDLAGLHDWLLALAAGESLDREPVARAETHPHPPRQLSRWGSVFGCDFAPASVGRTLKVTPDERVEGELESRFQVDMPTTLTPETRAALEALGYIE